MPDKEFTISCHTCDRREHQDLRNRGFCKKCKTKPSSLPHWHPHREIYIKENLFSGDIDQNDWGWKYVAWVCDHICARPCCREAYDQGNTCGRLDGIPRGDMGPGCGNNKADNFHPFIRRKDTYEIQN